MSEATSSDSSAGPRQDARPLREAPRTGSPERRFVNPEKVSPHLKCPICADVLREPVSDFSLCQCVFCHSCILQWLQSRAECPMDRQPMCVWGLQPNRVVRGLLDELEVYCRFQGEGCEWTGRLDAQKAHEERCPARKAARLASELSCAKAENAELLKANSLLTERISESTRLAKELEVDRRELRQLQAWLALAPAATGLALVSSRADPLSGSSAEWLRAEVGGGEADARLTEPSRGGSSSGTGLVECVLEEGRRVAQSIERAADGGRVAFFCCGLEEPAGDLELLRMALSVMGEELALGSGDSDGCRGAGGSACRTGEMLFSCGKEQLVLAAYVPQERSGELSCREWVAAVCAEVGGVVVEECGGTCTARVPMDAERGVCPQRVKNAGIQSALQILLANGTLRDLADPTWILREEFRSDDGEHDGRDRRNKIKLN